MLLHVAFGTAAVAVAVTAVLLLLLLLLLPLLLVGWQLHIAAAGVAQW